MKSKNVGAVLALIVYVLLIGAGAVGWVLNIVAIAHANFSELTGMMVLRCIGIFIAPLGAILGYI